jgi:radical SAM protein with 4Fe4S-binding SPASM domain
MALRKVVDKLFPKPPEPLQPGLFHYMREAEGNYTRFHLRIEPDGSGLLLANATAIARLTPSGVIIVRGLLEGKGKDEIAREISKRFRGASAKTIGADITKISEMLSTLASPDDNYPIINLEDAEFSPYEARLIAPFRADVPLATPEQLVPIVDKLWEIGIPHVSIITSERPNPQHLVRAVERAGDLGMIAGVRGLASCLAEGSLLKDLAQAGVDHVTVLYVSGNQRLHDSICGVEDHQKAERIFPLIRELEVCPVAEIPLTTATAHLLEETFESLVQMGIHNASFFAIARPDDDTAIDDATLRASALPQIAAIIEEASPAANVRYLWQPPVLRKRNKSLEQQIREGPRCSGDVSVRVEPDGSVIPPRGPYQSAGNILQDNWKRIWDNDAFRRYRERVESPTRCETCPGLAICAADCPRDPRGWAS